MKKTYESPELKGMNISVADIIMESQQEEPQAVTLKTVVNGNEGEDFGSAEVSLID